MSELLRVSSHSFLGVNTARYASAGHRVGQLAPCVATSKIAPIKVSAASFGRGRLPAELAGKFTALDAGRNDVEATTHHLQGTLSLADAGISRSILT